MSIELPPRVADEGALVPKEDAQMGEIEKQVLLVNCLKSASMSISILGNLNLIAAAAPDFKLTREDAEIELEHLKYPESFRASLSQVSKVQGSLLTVTQVRLTPRLQ